MSGSESLSRNILERISKNTNINIGVVTAVVDLLDQGATVPFISRYRKEKTGSLDEVGVLAIQNEKKSIESIIARKSTILKTIEDQGALTRELKDKIDNCWESNLLEDIYLPYKPKRVTRATKAKAAGLEPLAKEIMAQRNLQIKSMLPKYINQKIKTADQALGGAQDIISEWISENEKTRAHVRSAFKNGAMITAKVVKSKVLDAIKYRDYFDYTEKLSKCPSHRLLAIRRGEEEGLLRMSIKPDPDRIVQRMKDYFVRGSGDCAQWVSEAAEDAYKRLLAPSMESEFRKVSKENADKDAIGVFVDNLQQLLLSAPLGEKRIMAIDPGFRTGCKLVCLDENGNLLYNTAIYPHAPQKQYKQAGEVVVRLFKKYGADAVAIGNGTAGRETLYFIEDVLRDMKGQIFMVNESGASIYSASEVAREEFPDHDITVRGAVSIGRRLMDPLAELVKLDPKSIGVGQYQHDVNQVQLRESLDQTVQYCVNSVGINLNTASHSLLTHVSGLGETLAKNIVSYRSKNGPFSQRKQLMDVPRMGAKAFEQSAGFLRIRGSAEALDDTGVHPERYDIVAHMAADLGVSINQLIGDAELINKIPLKSYANEEVGMPTLNDIKKELLKPGLDPRGEVENVEFDQSVKTIEDLEQGMVLNGVVTNITNFGAFVDIGIKGDGLVHISQITNKFIKSPADVLTLGQAVKVKIIEVDMNRSRVNLSMKNV